MGVGKIQIASESPAGTTSLDCHRRPCAGGHRCYLSLAVFLKKVDLSARRLALRHVFAATARAQSRFRWIVHTASGLGNRESV
jgi:hypothetical protein